MRCEAPTLVLHRRRFATRSPGRVLYARSAPVYLSFNVQYHPHAAVKVHPIDTNCWVVLDSQINVLANTKTEITSLREVLFP